MTPEEQEKIRERAMDKLLQSLGLLDKDGNARDKHGNILVFDHAKNRMEAAESATYVTKSMIDQLINDRICKRDHLPSWKELRTVLFRVCICDELTPSEKVDRVKAALDAFTSTQNFTGTFSIYGVPEPIILDPELIEEINEKKGEEITLKQWIELAITERLEKK
jgi:hypothetical protein